MRRWHWYRGWYGGLTLAAVLAIVVTLPVGAQQAQAKPGNSAAASGKPAATPFDPCTGDGLPATAQTAPFAPGSPSDMTPPEPKSYGGKVSCSNGKCRSTGKDSYAAPAKQPGLPLSAAAQQKNAAASAPVKAPAPSAAEANPFPEAQSKAAQEKAQKEANQPPPQKGAYSSSNQRMPGVNALGNGPAEFTGSEGHPSYDPYLAAQDDKVGKFYLHSGDWPGAYGRYKEATEVNPGDIAAVMGLAIAADHMGKRAEAIENYKLYLAAMPNGPHSKEALKALKRLGTGH